MNVFLHELRMRRKSAFIWTISLFLLMVVSMAKFEAITAQGGAAMRDMMKSFPATIQAVFGMNGLDLTTVGGYFGVCYLLLAVALSVYAGLTGVGILAEEEADRTTEFLYVKPRSRTRIITAKVYAGLVLLAIVWGAGVAGSIVGIQKYAQFEGFSDDFWRMMAATGTIAFVFFFTGSAVAAMTRQPGVQGRTIAIAIFGSYLIYVFAKIATAISWIHFASIFSWFDAVDILSTLRLKTHYLVACGVLILLCLALTHLCYQRRDLRT